MSKSISFGGLASPHPAFELHSPQKSQSQPCVHRYRSLPSPEQPQPSQHQPPPASFFSSGCSCLDGGNSGRLVIFRIWPAMPPFSMAMVNTSLGSSSPLAFASSLYLTARGAIAASADCCTLISQVSHKAMTVGSSLILPAPLFRLDTGLGYHGNSAPVGSSLINGRPSLLMTDPSLSMIVTLGMPRTPNKLLSCSFRFRSLNSRASHGISLKYSLKALSSLSEETKTISNPLAFKSALYHSAKRGVKPLQGGHQCALK
mmetsp:Transcript_74394/g.159456  ORF Transcript_74394/g.159456 Transcript_74394/m.159456 type:complete len:259 (-) Transcript_74394:599-1375(-)